MTKYHDVKDFHDKFGLSYNGPPRILERQEQNFRISCMREEMMEYEAALQSGDLAEQLDALVDLVYFAIGTAHRQGFQFDMAFTEVHAANMRKERDPAKQRRSYALEVTKPKDWVGPQLDFFVNQETAPFLDTVEGLSGLITIDGPDHAGKTTLGRRIAETTGGEYIGLTWNPHIETMMDAYRKANIAIACILAKNKVVILDRAWLSHPIYGMIFRGKCQEYRQWREMCNAHARVNIIAVPSTYKTWAEGFKHSGRKQLYKDEMKMFKVWGEFLKVANGDTSYGVISNRVQYDMYEDGKTPADMDRFINEKVLMKLNHD